MSAADARLDIAKAEAYNLFRRKRLLAFSAPTVVLIYFTYIFFAFDLPGLAQRANWENAITLASDSWSHKVHVTRSNRSGEINYAVEASARVAIPRAPDLSGSRAK